MKSGGCISEEAKGVARYLDVGTCCFSSRFCPRLHPSISSSISSTSSSFFFPSLSLFFYSSFRRSPIFSSSIPFLSLSLSASHFAPLSPRRRGGSRHATRREPLTLWWGEVRILLGFLLTWRAKERCCSRYNKAGGLSCNSFPDSNRRISRGEKFHQGEEFVRSRNL